MIANNSAGDDGGGIYINTNEEKIEIINTTISENECEGNGGGVYADVYDDGDVGNVLIAHSTIVQNKVGVEIVEDYDRISRGGGLYTKYNVDLDYADAVLYHTIIADNQDKSDSGDDTWGESNEESRYVHNIFIDGPYTEGTNPTSSCRIVADYCFLDSAAIPESHVSPINAFIPLDYYGNGNGSIIVDNSNFYDSESVVDPNLLDHGGQTLTQALLPTHLLQQNEVNNPAIDGGDPYAVAEGNRPGVTGSHAIPVFDQRGVDFSRVVDIPGLGSESGLIIDIGAYEVNLPKVIDVRIDDSSWDRNAYSFAEHMPLGEQLRPLATQNVSQIQILFSERVCVQESDGTLRPIQSPTDGNALLDLRRTRIDENGNTLNDTVTATNLLYDSELLTGTWTFPVLGDGKFAIHLLAGLAISLFK